MVNFRWTLLFILLVLLSTNISKIFAIDETFSILPDEQKTFDITLQDHQKIFFQVFVSGGENNDIRLKIIDKNTNYEYHNSIIRELNENTEFGSPEFPAYKNEITNNNPNAKILSFTFDNSLSSSSSKNIDFTYSIFTDSESYFEKTSFWSLIFELLIIVIGIVIGIIVIVIVAKKIKGRKIK